MSIQSLCQCGYVSALDDAMAGSSFRCPRCHMDNMDNAVSPSNAMKAVARQSPSHGPIQRISASSSLAKTSYFLLVSGWALICLIGAAAIVGCVRPNSPVDEQSMPSPVVDEEGAE